MSSFEKILKNSSLWKQKKEIDSDFKNENLERKKHNGIPYKLRDSRPYI